MTTFDRAIEALERRAWQDGLEVSNGAPLVRAVLLAIREPDERMADIMLQAGLSAVVTDDPLSFSGVTKQRSGLRASTPS